MPSFRETFPARASEWALALMLCNWSLVLFLNDDLFRTGSSYRPLLDIMSQGAWAWACLVFGGGRLMVLYINGNWRRSPHLRALGAFFTCFFWFQITMGFLEAGTFATGLAIYPVLLLLDSYNVIRSTGEAGLSDHLHKRTTVDGNHV